MARPAARRPATERTFFWRAIGILVPVVTALFRLRVRGSENLPSTGAFVVCPNHTTDLDPIVVGYTVWRLGRIPRFLAKASLFRVPVVGWILRNMGGIPVLREGGGADPLAAAQRIVDAGAGVIIYPEGTLTRQPDLWPMRGRSGAVRLARRSGIPIIPVAHWGAEQVLPRWGKRLHVFPRKLVRISFGAPIPASELGDGTLASEKAATERVMVAITELVEELRGETAPPGRWNPADHGQTEFGRP